MNHKSFKLIFMLIMLILATSACSLTTVRGSGNLITESRSISNIDRVDLGGSGKLIITQGGEESLTVETDDNMMQYVSTEVRDGTLYLGFEGRDSKGQSISPTRLRFTLTVKGLTGIGVSGSGDITTASLDTDRLEVNIGGSGNVQVDSLTAREVEVGIGGNGNVDLAGEVTGQDISINGSGKYDAENLRSETVKINIGGSGNATVWATESLDASVGGSGSVEYYGNPQTSLSGSGVGKIKGLGEK